MKLLLPALLLLALGTAACDGSGGGRSPSSEPSVAGSLGPFTSSAARAVVSGLCDMRDPAIGLDRANTVFFEQVHGRLHVLAAAIEPIDRTVSADLFEAKEKVELDLDDDALPASYADDVANLLGAVGAALDTAGLPSTGCR